MYSYNERFKSKGPLNVFIAIPKSLNRITTNQIQFFLFPYSHTCSQFIPIVSPSINCTKKILSYVPPRTGQKELSLICHKQIVQVLYGEVRLSASLFIFTKCRRYHHSLLLLHWQNLFRDQNVLKGCLLRKQKKSTSSTYLKG